MSWCPQPPTCTYYQPLPISTGTVGIDRCGNIEVYAAPEVVKRHVHWEHWPVPAQLPWWPWCGGQFPGVVGPGPPSWGGVPPGSPGWWPPPVDPGFSAPPWWGQGGPVASPAPMAANANIRQAAQARGTAMAEWMLNVRNTLNAMPR